MQSSNIIAKSRSPKGIILLILLAAALPVFIFATFSFAATDDETILEAIQYRIKGYTYQRQGDFPKATEFYKKAIQSAPFYACAHNDLGVLYEQNGQDDKAEQEYLKAIDVDSTYASAYSNLAMLYERKGLTEQACYYWGKRADAGQASDQWTIKAKRRYAELTSMLADQEKAKRDNMMAASVKKLNSPKEGSRNIEDYDQSESQQAGEFAKKFAAEKTEENKIKAKQEKENKRKNEICDNYLASATKYMQKGNFDSAARQYNKIKEINPSYPHVDNLLGEAQNAQLERNHQIKVQAEQERNARLESANRQKFQEQKEKEDLKEKKYREQVDRDQERLRRDRKQSEQGQELQAQPQEELQRQKQKEEEKLKRDEERKLKKEAEDKAKLEREKQKEQEKLKQQQEAEQKKAEKEKIRLEKQKQAEQEKLRKEEERKEKEALKEQAKAQKEEERQNLQQAEAKKVNEPAASKEVAVKQKKEAEGKARLEREKQKEQEKLKKQQEDEQKKAEKEKARLDKQKAEAAKKAESVKKTEPVKNAAPEQKVDKSAKDAEKLRQQNLKIAQQHFERGQKLYLDSRYDRASKEFESALALNPDYPEASRLLRYCQRRTGQGYYRPLEAIVTSQPSVQKVDVKQAIVEKPTASAYKSIEPQQERETPEAVEKNISQEVQAEERSSSAISASDVEKKYQVIGVVAYRSELNDMNALNDELLKKAKAMGAEEVIQVRYFQNNGFTYGYGTAVVKKKKK